MVGIPGAGKTMVSSGLYEYLKVKRSNVDTVMFNFDENERNI
jgi:adenylate kinase